MSNQGGQRFDILFGLHPDGVFAFDPDGRLVAANPALSSLTGYSTGELLSMPLARLVAPEDLEKLRFHFAAAQREGTQTAEFTCVRKDGTRFDASVMLLPHVANGELSGLHGIVKDISQRKQDERQIVYLAKHDPLTGLPNRSLLIDRMQFAIEKAHQRKSRIGVLVMGLNRFKLINDSLGHEQGDILLCTIADRLKAAVQENNTVARLGGDEFVIFLENIHTAKQVSALARRLLKAVGEPTELAGNTVTVSTSIGISIYPEDGDTPTMLLKHADLAMYDAKAAGVGVFRLYGPEMNAKASGRLARETDLRQAVEYDQLALYYQPRLDIATKKLVGVEALVRWNHPEKGLILPAHFIPLAEEIGMIDAIGRWVLFSACQQVKHWQEAGLPAFKVSVNISALQFRSESIYEDIVDVLQQTGLDPRCVELEITESSLMQDLDASSEKLRNIRDLGVSFSIDDFGTGYSSLSYLKTLPINTLKIDKSFIRDLSDNQNDAAIVTATVAMAHSMNLRVVAEGVTSLAQMRFLEACRCDEIQGFLLSEPLPPADTEVFFRTGQARRVNHFTMH